MIGKTSDGLYHGLEHREDLRRFARSLVQLDEMVTRYPDPGIGPDDVTQTGTGAKTELPRERAEERTPPTEEPAPTEWMTETSTESNADANRDDGQ